MALAMAVVALPLMVGLTSCKEDSKTEIPAAQAVAGNYTGTLDVVLAGQPVDELSGQPATIKVTQTGSTVTLQLTQSPLLDQFFGGQAIGAQDVTVTKIGDTYTLAGNGQVSMGSQSLDMTVSGNGKPSAMQFIITVPNVTVIATFNGSLQ